MQVASLVHVMQSLDTNMLRFVVHCRSRTSNRLLLNSPVMSLDQVEMQQRNGGVIQLQCASPEVRCFFKSSAGKLLLMALTMIMFPCTTPTVLALFAQWHYFQAMAVHTASRKKRSGPSMVLHAVGIILLILMIVPCYVCMLVILDRHV